MTTSHRLTDERLAWLAAKPYCARQAARINPLASIALALSGGRARYLRRRTGERLMDYGIAVDDVARRLTPEERATLRQTGQLPAWFCPAVDEKYAALLSWRKES